MEMKHEIPTDHIVVSGWKISPIEEIFSYLIRITFSVLILSIHLLKGTLKNHLHMYLVLNGVSGEIVLEYHLCHSQHFFR